MEKQFKRFVTLFRNGFTGIPDFDFDFIEAETLPGEEFEDTANRLTKEFHEIIDISEKRNYVDEFLKSLTEIGDIVNSADYDNEKSTDMINIGSSNKTYCYFKVGRLPIYISVYALDLREAMVGLSNAFNKSGIFREYVITNKNKIISLKDFTMFSIPEKNFLESINNIYNKGTLYNKYDQIVFDITWDMLELGDIIDYD